MLSTGLDKIDVLRLFSSHFKNVVAIGRKITYVGGSDCRFWDALPAGKLFFRAFRRRPQLEGAASEKLGSGPASPVFLRIPAASAPSLRFPGTPPGPASVPAVRPTWLSRHPLTGRPERSARFSERPHLSRGYRTRLPCLSRQRSRRLRRVTSHRTTTRESHPGCAVSFDRHSPLRTQTLP